LPPFHAHTVTVPGACAGWCDLVARHGRLDMPRVLAPAIRLAEEGFPVAPITAYFWDRGVERQLRHALGGLALTIDGRAPRPGEIFRNPDLANTFRIVAEGGKQAFYEGPIATNIAAVVQAAGGVMTPDDLAAHGSTWDEPISVVYRGVRVWECPPNGQGLAALLALNLLEAFDLGSMSPLSAERLHLQIEAMRLAFADVGWYVADPAFNPAPLAQLLSKEYAAERRKLLNLARATISPDRGSPKGGSDTVYLTVVDGEGNACSFINSNYSGFGTGLVPEGRGFTLQNRGHNFSLDPAHPNALAPRKRPYHTIIPAMATREADGSLYASFGVMGGFMQPQGHMQVVCALGDDDADPQSALDRPRFCITAPNAAPQDAEAGGVALEEGIPGETLARLRDMGHPVSLVQGYARALFGRGQIILRDPETGVLTGGSDPRADGCAMTF
jgi:gamma-glutamyltranspeptidase/glutathione hydrolase